MSRSRSKQKLTNVHDATSNIASDEVSVHTLQVRRRKDPPRQNAFAEAGSEALNLPLQFLEHVYF